MTVSEITTNVLKDWLGVSDGDETALNACLTAAKSRAVGYTGLTLAELDEHEDGYTGLTLAELDEHEDITIAVIGMVNDFYTNNRPDTAQIAINPMSRNILNMYSKNLL